MVLDKPSMILSDENCDVNWIRTQKVFSEQNY
jgi:hypothetical protein